MEEGIDKVVTNWNLEPIPLSDNDIKLREILKRLEASIIYAFSLNIAKSSLKSADTKLIDTVANNEDD